MSEQTDHPNDKRPASKLQSGDQLPVNWPGGKFEGKIPKKGMQG